MGVAGSGAHRPLVRQAASRRTPLPQTLEGARLHPSTTRHRTLQETHRQMERVCKGGETGDALKRKKLNK